MFLHFLITIKYCAPLPITERDCEVAEADITRDPVITASPVNGKPAPLPPPPPANEADVNIPPPIDAVNIDTVPLELM